MRTRLVFLVVFFFSLVALVFGLLGASGIIRTPVSYSRGMAPGSMRFILGHAVYCAVMLTMLVISGRQLLISLRSSPPGASRREWRLTLRDAASSNGTTIRVTGSGPAQLSVHLLGWVSDSSREQEPRGSDEHILTVEAGINGEALSRDELVHGAGYADDPLTVPITSRAEWEVTLVLRVKHETHPKLRAAGSPDPLHPQVSITTTCAAETHIHNPEA